MTDLTVKKEETRNKRNRRKIWPIVLGVIVLVVAVAAIWMFGTSRIETASSIILGKEGTRSVVVYFTRVGETKAGVDAMSAATFNTNSADAAVGDTEAAARLVAAVTGADRVQLFTESYYRDSFAGTAARALVERYLNLRLAIGLLADLSGYDIIYVGYPIWWFNAPMAVATFLENAGLSGKTVIPFCTSQDNDVDLSMDLIRKAAPEATVLEGIRLHGADEETVKVWLEDIHIPFEE